MSIRRITETRTFPVEACVFSAAAVLAENEVDEDEDDEAEAAEGDEEGDEAEAGDGDGDDDAEAAEGDEEGEDEDAEAMDDEAEAKASGDSRGFTVVANSGKPMTGVPFWGTLGVDLEGIKAKRRVPALMDHDVTKRVGVFESRELTENGLEMRGTFLKRSKLARQVNQELRDGFPMEASVRLNPTRIEEIAAGQTAEVNGHTVNGPAFIFRESELRETSLVTLGQDPHTAAAALAEGGATGSATFEKLEQQDEPEAKDAGAVERERQKQLRAAATPEQAALLEQLIDDGTEVADGIAKLHADLVTRWKARSDERHSSAAAPTGGNAGDAQPKLSAVERVRAMPDSRKKFAKLFEIDEAVQADFTSSEAYVAYEVEQARQRGETLA